MQLRADTRVHLLRLDTDTRIHLVAKKIILAHSLDCAGDITDCNACGLSCQWIHGITESAEQDLSLPQDVVFQNIDPSAVATLLTRRTSWYIIYVLTQVLQPVSEACKLDIWAVSVVRVRRRHCMIAAGQYSSSSYAFLKQDLAL